MKDNLVRYKVSDRIAEITLNRPEKRNALNPSLIEALKAAFERAKEEQSVKIVVLKAQGDVFSAGADLAYLQQLQQNDFASNLADSKMLKELFELIRTLPKVVIAQVEGHAIAGGCGIASICDFVLAVPEAKFGYTEVKLGFVPAIVSCYLMSKIGETQAKRLLLTGDLISAEEAQKINLINFVTKTNEINQKVREFALHLCNTNSGNSMAETKALLNYPQKKWLDDCLENAVLTNARVRESDDFRQGISRFLARKKIEW